AREATSPESIEAADSVRVALALKQEAATSRSANSASKFEFIMGAVRGRPMLMRLNANGRGRGPVNSASLALRRVGNRVIYEASVPWSEIGRVKPRSNSILNIALQVTDSDGIHRRTMEWPVGTIGAVDSNNFQAIRLTR